ncbi:MAG: urease accessory protein UreF [Caulobacter sp.]|nr:urease accessory protein UreF [Caulobacter sp.]
MTTDKGRSLLRLLTWLSPAFPVGMFGWSHGLEQAIADGTVRDGDGLIEWIIGLVEFGSGWTDAVLLAEAHAAASDPGRLDAVADLARALAPSAERLAETLGQGTAFLKAVAAWPDARPPLNEAPWPVAVGASCGLAEIAGEDALAATLHAFAANLVSVALRAIPLGQTEGVRVLAAVEPVVLATAARAARSTLDDLGSAAIMSDIAALRHETLQPRLFLS